MYTKKILAIIPALCFALTCAPLKQAKAQSVDEETNVEKDKTRRTEEAPTKTAAVESKAQLAARAAKILDEIMETPDQNIPFDLLNRAECVAVLPATLKAGFIVGANYGYGLVSCRQKESGHWGAPAFFTLAGGSLGFQIGAKATDLVLLIMNDKGLNGLLNGEVTLGADLGVAAGPVGRSASASTDVSMQASILSYSRSEGLFAGVDIGGSVLRYDTQATKELYSQEWTAKTVLMGDKEIPLVLAGFPRTLGKYAPQRIAKKGA